jgi:hypothetical protein
MIGPPSRLIGVAGLQAGEHATRPRNTARQIAKCFIVKRHSGLCFELRIAVGRRRKRLEKRAAPILNLYCPSAG